MSKSKIEWTNETWNPIVGCSKISDGCKNCYAEKMAGRLWHMQKEDGGPYADLGCFDGWNGKTVFVESALEKPLKRKKPTTYFICSMGDIFHKSVPLSWVDRVLAIVALCPQHKFIILTKRAERMHEYFSKFSPLYGRASKAFEGIFTKKQIVSSNSFVDGILTFRAMDTTPLDNLILGVTAENQEMADKRIPLLLQTPAACRMVSIEPMLSAIDLTRIDTGSWSYGKVDVMSGFLCGDEPDDIFDYDADPRGFVRKPSGEWERGEYGIDWIICGGESGANARPMHPDWARSLRDQCQQANVPFFFKQWGAWLDFNQMDNSIAVSDAFTKLDNYPDAFRSHEFQDKTTVYKVGKKKAGKLLDGVEYLELPEILK